MINVSKLYCGLAGQSDDLRYSPGRSVGPVVVYNCTSRCNLRCRHCYSLSAISRDDEELTTDQARDLLRQLADANCPVVLFSGGEPLLRADLFELLAHAKRLGLRTVISTNGTLIDADTAGRLAECGVDYIGVSIDGDEKFHDDFRVQKGSFKAAVSGLENCRKAGIRVGLRFTITRANADQIPTVFDVARSIGIGRICFYHLIRTGRAAELEGQTLSPEQTRHVLDVIIEKTDDFVRRGLAEEVLTVGNHADGPYILLKLQPERKDDFEKARQLLLANGGNRIGEKIACVSWDGSVHPDQFWRNYSAGNVTQRTFGQIWNDPQEPVLRRLRNKAEFADPKCRRCKWFDLCKGNYRFLGDDSGDSCWLLEPPCYLTDSEIASESDESLI